MIYNIINKERMVVMSFIKNSMTITPNNSNLYFFKQKKKSPIYLQKKGGYV